MTLRRLRLLLVIFGLCVCLAPLGAHAATSPQTTNTTKPNIVFILLDNVGWGDFGVYGGTVATPRVDRLASEGIRFNNYNVAAQCTPTRSTIMTGRYAVRSGTASVVPMPGRPFGMTPWEYTIAKLLSDDGYATALYGKWHLGNIQGRLPNDQGFDEWWGIPDSWDEAGYTSYALYNALVKQVLAKEHQSELLDVPPHILEGVKGQPSRIVMPLDMKVRPIVDGTYLIPKTIEFIKREAAAKKPFFVYLGYSEMHPPVACNPAFVGKSPNRGGEYADCIAEMDYRVGQILDAIKQAGIDNNTIVVLSSDDAADGLNGMGNTVGGSNGPWRGNFFYTPWEGSMRTLCMVRWPGHVPAGIVTDEMLASVDWLPTFAGMVGASNLVPKDRPIDGIDASAFMLGKSSTTGRDSYLFFGPDGQLMSVKWKYYKMVLRYVPGPGEQAINNGYVAPQLPLFFDLSSDPHEDYNLWSTTLTMAWVYAPMLQIMGAYDKSVREYPNIPQGADFTGYSKKSP